MLKIRKGVAELFTGVSKDDVKKANAAIGYFGWFDPPLAGR